MSGVLEKIRTILSDLIAVEEDEIVPEASLVEDLGADSLDIVAFIEALEKEYAKEGFALEITDEDAEGVETVQQVVEMLIKKGVEK